MSGSWGDIARSTSTALGFFFNTFYFEMIFDLQEVPKNSKQVRVLVSSNGSIWHNHSTVSTLGNWHWYNPQTLVFRFHSSTCTHLRTPVWVQACVVLCDFITCRFVQLSPQSRGRTIPAWHFWTLTISYLASTTDPLLVIPGPLQGLCLEFSA